MIDFYLLLLLRFLFAYPIAYQRDEATPRLLGPIVAGQYRNAKSKKPLQRHVNITDRSGVRGGTPLLNISQ